MLTRKMFGGLLAVGVMTGVAFAGTPKPHGDHGGDPVLPEGQYSAQVKSMVCGGCGPLIEKTMKGLPGIDSAAVDSKTGRVQFAVKKGASVEWAKIKSALKDAAGKMGMGADYTLSDFQMASGSPHGMTGNPHGAKSQDQSLTSGYYTARVGAITCDGCGPLIEKTMRQVPGIGAAQVDAKTATVKFTVMEGKKVPLADLQKALKLAADQMGMGADYGLSEIKPLKKA
ncbi:MAG: heavy-metal-associated domain-containing protein [Elusimicrobia bacterium]|nr:heavy-metal-associated domain-containing protein [Elusimicrobiota bacterium]